MPQLQTLNQNFLKEQARVFYDRKGKPEFVILPFAKYQTLEKTAAQKFYDIADKEIVNMVDEVREKLFSKRYAQKI